MFIGGPERAQPERLGRLDAGQTGAVHRIAERLADARQRVPDRQHRRSAFEELQAGEQAIDDGVRAEGARSIVNEDRVALHS